MQTPFVFVYGTLRVGERNAHFLDEMELKYEGAWLIGELYDTGLGYPVLDLRNPTQKVIGDIYRITPEKLKELDFLEGYHRNRRYNLYQRVVKPVETNRGKVDCYLYIRDQLHTESEQLILSGDWKKRGEHANIPLQLHPQWEKGISNQDFLYFVQLAERHQFVDNAIHCVPIRTGFNREGELYATVLIQNGYDNDIALSREKGGRYIPDQAYSCLATYVLQQSTIAQLPLPYSLTLPAKKLMPWTFVFSNEAIQQPKHLIHQSWFKGAPWDVELEFTPINEG